jgi:hypothetical protein
MTNETSYWGILKSLTTTKSRLEVPLGGHPGASPSPYVLSFSNINDIPEGKRRQASATASNYRRDIVSSTEFDRDDAVGELGTHSIREFASM